MLSLKKEMYQTDQQAKEQTLETTSDCHSKNALCNRSSFAWNAAGV